MWHQGGWEFNAQTLKFIIILYNFYKAYHLMNSSLPKFRPWYNVKYADGKNPSRGTLNHHLFALLASDRGLKHQACPSFYVIHLSMFL